MITVPFYTAVDHAIDPWSIVWFEQGGLLAAHATWTGTQEDRGQARADGQRHYPLEFHIGQLLGPAALVRAFYNTYGDIVRITPPLYYVGRLAVTELQRPVLTAIGPTLTTGDMMVAVDLAGIYLDGRVRSRQWFDRNVCPSVSVPPAAFTRAASIRV